MHEEMKRACRLVRGDEGGATERGRRPGPALA